MYYQMWTNWAGKWWKGGGGPCINDFDRHHIFFRALDFWYVIEYILLHTNSHWYVVLQFFPIWPHILAKWLGLDGQKRILWLTHDIKWTRFIYLSKTCRGSASYVIREQTDFPQLGSNGATVKAGVTKYDARYPSSYSTNHVYLHRPNAFGFWQTCLHLCYETLKRISNFSELA